MACRIRRGVFFCGIKEEGVVNLGMLRRVQNLPLIENFRKLEGNTRISVIFEFFFSVANTLYTFYLSLYMKGCGVTDREIGLVVAVSYFFGIIFALSAGEIVNRLGRKKTTTIFELLAWPGSCLIFLFANNFWMFALGKIVNSLSQISNMSWNFMVVEDADDDQRVAALNILTMLHTAIGVITPIGGLLVTRIGIISAQKVFLIFAIVVFATEMIIRNRFYTETKVGQEILAAGHPPLRLGNINPLSGFKILWGKKMILSAILLNVIYNAMYPLSTHFSLYLNVYLTDVIGIDPAAVSLVGGCNSIGLLLTCLLVIPVINHFIRTRVGMGGALVAGFFIQIPYMFLMIFLPHGSLTLACVAALIYSSGYAMCKTFLDSLVASVTEEEAKNRGKIYAVMNVMISAVSTLMSSLSGLIYALRPSSIFFLSAVMLTVNLFILAGFIIRQRMLQKREAKSEEEACAAL